MITASIDTMLEKYVSNIYSKGISPSSLMHLGIEHTNYMLDPVKCEIYTNKDKLGSALIIVYFKTVELTEDLVMKENSSYSRTIIGSAFVKPLDYEIIDNFIETKTNLSIASSSDNIFTDSLLAKLKEQEKISFKAQEYYELDGVVNNTNNFNIYGPQIIEKTKELNKKKVCSIFKNKVLGNLDKYVYTLAENNLNTDGNTKIFAESLLENARVVEDNGYVLQLDYKIDFRHLNPSEKGVFLPEKIQDNGTFSFKLPIKSILDVEDTSNDLMIILHDFIKKLQNSEQMKYKNLEILATTQEGLDPALIEIISGGVKQTSDDLRKQRETLERANFVVNNMVNMGMPIKDISFSNGALYVTLPLSDSKKTEGVSVILGGNGFTSDLFRFTDVAFVRGHWKYGSLSEATNKMIHIFGKEYVQFWKAISSVYDLRRRIGNTK